MSYNKYDNVKLTEMYNGLRDFRRLLFWKGGDEMGRPPMYSTEEDLLIMKERIEQYYKSCEGEVLRDDDGKIFLDKYGQPIVINAKPPTITGLALALGFNSRQSLLNYQGKKRFMDTITRAKAHIEEYTERRLFDRDGVQGAKFSLSNNFRGWADTVNFTGDMGVQIVNDIPKDKS